jgi:ribosomal-protein-alanine N-acetyltransferase
MLFLPNVSVQETENFLRSVEQEWQQEHPSAFEFAIVLDDVQIGAVSISLGEITNQGEIGWILNKKYWNYGYVSEAAKAVLDFAKNQLHLQRVIAQCDCRNIASARVMEKIGMQLIDERGTRTYVKREETARELTYMIEF